MREVKAGVGDRIAEVPACRLGRRENDTTFTSGTCSSRNCDRLKKLFIKRGNVMKSILVVDDDRVFRSYIAEALSSKGYLVNTAESGGQLLSQLKTGLSPAVILLDVHMPETDGIELISRVKELGWNIPIIMLSGVNHVRTVVEAMKLGACDFI